MPDFHSASEELFAICKGIATTSEERIEPLLTEYPKAARVSDQYNSLPLHYALSNAASLRVVQCVLNAWPEAVRIPGPRGCYPLLMACRAYHTHPDVIRALLQVWPEAVLERGHRSKRLPLHWACSWNANPEVIRVLVESFPSAVKSTDADGNFPIHLACGPLRRSWINPDIIRVLTKAWPESVLEVDGKGHLPVDLSCASPYPNHKPTAEVMQSLTGDDDWDPLHFVSVHSMDCETMEQATLLFKESTKKMVDGQLPLHRVCARSAADISWTAENRLDQMVEILLHAYPEAARVASLGAAGDLPLHCYCRVKSRNPDALKVVKSLIKFHPKAVITSNRAGFNPIHCASMSENLGIAYFLARLCPEYFLPFATTGLEE